MTTCYVLFGSNEGKRAEIFERACRCIDNRCGKIVAVSSSYETEPWGFECEEWFLNRLIVLDTEMQPKDLMKAFLDIEAELGRVRHKDTARYVSRPIDLDLLYYGDIVLNDEDLIVPHPRLHQRRFALLPMCELGPDFIHPVLHRSQIELLRDCPDQSEVRRL